MAFVKLDCGILRSTLWMDRTSREIFITALLMAEPREIFEPMEQYEVDNLNLTGWKVPPGWYGFVDAAGVGIIRMALVEKDEGIEALKVLGNPEPDSRSSDFEGRRLVRINGGFLVLNFMRYRDRDHGGAERAKRYRERIKNRKVTNATSHRDVTPSPRDVTHSRVQSAEAEKKEDMLRTSSLAHALPDTAKAVNSNGGGAPTPTDTHPARASTIPELSASFEPFMVETFPYTSHRRDFGSAWHFAQGIVGGALATEADLRRRVTGFRAYVDTGGYSDPSKVPTPQAWFKRHQQGEAYWSREWEAVKAGNGKSAEDAQAVHAWDRLLATDGAERTPTVQAALQKIGGWSRVNERTTQQARFIRAEFIEAFVAAAVTA